MRALALSLALGCCLLFARGAAAATSDETLQPPPPPAPAYYYPPPGYYYGYPPPPPPPRAKRTWYGWQTLATDGAAFLMIYAAAQSRGGSEGLAYGSLATYTLGAPIVHFGHNNYGRGLGSLAVRSLPAFLIFAEPRGQDYSLALLTVVSIPTIIALDAALFAREDQEEERPAPVTGMKVAPTAVATHNGGMLGVAGSF